VTENAEPPPTGLALIDLKTGFITEPWLRWLEGRAVSSQAGIGSLISGFNQAQQQNAARDAAEQAARIAGDAASQGGGSGATSNSAPFSGGVSSGTTWVTIGTVTLTPTGAGGDYTITVTPDVFINGHLSNEGPAGATFTGNWRVREELSAGGTEYTLDSGTFTITYTAENVIELGEGGGTVVVPEQWEVAFTGLPSGLIAANEGAQVDIRLEIQRASGTNEITAPGLSGAMMVVWTA
jgi:hypothetical protein